MTEQEFFEEPVKPKEVGKAPIVVGPSTSIYDDEVLPDNVFKVYMEGQICYMTCSEDGRIVRLDEWTMPGILD
jgi:hypothetical protein